MMFDCCCIAKVRLAMTSLLLFACATLDEIWPTNAIMMLRIMTATITSMSDKPLRDVIGASPYLDHPSLRDLQTARVSVRREGDDHRVGRETVGIDLDPGRRWVIADVGALQIVARSERSLAIGRCLTAIGDRHLHPRRVAPYAHWPTNTTGHGERHPQIIGEADGCLGDALVREVCGELAHRERAHHEHDDEHGEQLHDREAAAVEKHGTLVNDGPRQERVVAIITGVTSTKCALSPPFHTVVQRAARSVVRHFDDRFRG